MKNNELLDEFHLLAEKLDVKIMKGKGDFSGGSCTVNDEKVIVINNGKPIEQRLNILASCFKDYNLDDLSQLIQFGASPRATINLILAAKARAFLEHRGYITPEDIRYIGQEVLCHRIILTYEAEAEELTSYDVIQRLFESIEIP